MKRPSFPHFYRQLRSRLAPRLKQRTTEHPPSLARVAGLYSLAETLELRLAPAATVTAGVLHVTGDDGGTPFDDLVTIKRDGPPGTELHVQQNGNNFFFSPAAVNEIVVDLFEGNDSLTIDLSSGNPLKAGGLVYDGGSGRNVLNLINGNETSDVHTAGPNPGQGKIDLSISTVPGAATSVSYQNLAPVNDFLVGPLVVNGTPANNAISYVEGFAPDGVTHDPNRGLVTIDNFEPVQFSNKTTLTINALGGSDEISINNPVIPTGLTGITVNGGDPSGSDTLIVNSEGHNLVLEPTAQGAGTVNYFGGGVPSVSFTGIEGLTLVDTSTNPFGIDGTAGNDQFIYTPGVTPDTGTVNGTMNGGGASFPLVPVTFVGMSQAGVVIFNTFGQQGGTDSFVFNGTTTSDNVSIVNGGVGVFGGVTLTDTVNSTLFAKLDLVNMTNVTVQDHSGNDTFTLSAPLGPTFVIDGSHSSAFDSVILNGTSGGDAIGLTLGAASDTVTGIAGGLSIIGVENLAINGLGGTDAFTVTNFGTASSLHHVALDGGGQSDTLAVSTTAGADNITYIPAATDGGSLAANGLGPDLAFTTLSGTFTLDPLGGEDTLTVKGTALNDNIAIGLNAAVTVQVNAFELIKVTNGANLEHLIVSAGAGADNITVSGTGALNTLLINGEEGDDATTVDFGGGNNPIPAFGLTFDGGLGNDSLTLINGTETAETYQPGLIPGAGSIQLTVNQINSTIYFANLEPLTDSLSGPLTVNGTPASNAINYTEGQNSNFGLVSVDNFEAIQFTNKTTLTINAGAGDDVINLNNRFVPSGLTDIFVDSGDATASDKVDVTDHSNVQDTITFTPTASDAADITMTGFPDVHLTHTEAVTINGNGINDVLDVVGTNGDDIFNYTPGATVDSGFVQVNSLVPLTFVNMGAAATVTLDGNGARNFDTLVFNGTALDDTINVTPVSGIIKLNNAIGDYLPVTPRGISALKLNGLDGDDQFLLNGATPYTDGVTVSGGDPSGSDVLFITGAKGVAETATIAPNAFDPTRQEITGIGSPIHVSGIELIHYTGEGTNDTLTVIPGRADDSTIFITNGSNGDRVLSQTLPEVQFTALNTFVLDASNGGAQTVTFETNNLHGALLGNYQMIGGSNDTLVIQGNDASSPAKNDSFTVTKPGVGPVAVTHNNAQAGAVTVTEKGTLGRLQINGLGGDDNVTVDVDGTPLITVPITFDGGAGFDALTVTGTPTTAVSSVTYTPGPIDNVGRLVYVGGGTMTIDFANLEPVTDLVPADSLIVNGTTGNDSISYYSGGGVAVGNVVVNAFEELTFSNKTALVLNGDKGSDEFSLNADTTPTGLTSITVNGDDPTASDTLIVSGSSIADTFIFSATSGSAGKVNLNMLPVINYTGIEHTILDGQGNDDLFRVGSDFGNVTVIGGDGSDTIDFRDATKRVIFDLRKLDVPQRVNTAHEFVTLGDEVENFTGTDFNDIIFADVQPFARHIHGGPVVGDEPPGTVPPGDTLNIDGNGAVLNVHFTGAESGTATGFGYAPITFEEIETLHTFNVAGSPFGTGGTGSSLNDTAFNPAITYPTGHRPRGIFQADMNNDGHIDLILTARHEGVVQVMLGNGDGTFQSPLTFSSGGSHPTALTVGDFDGINGPDIAVVNANSKDVVILKNNGAPVPTFTISSTIPGLGKDARSIVAGQLDGLNGDDLVVTNNHTSTVSVLLNTGGLSFGPVTNFATGGHQARDVKIVDLDGVNGPDLVIANAASNNVSVLLNNGAGGFGAPTLFKAGKHSDSIVVGDFNHDGNQDVVVSNSSTAYISVLLGDGNGGLLPQIQAKYPRGQRLQSIGVGDFNFDGNLDLVVADRRSNTLNFLLGVGNGTFVSPIAVRVGEVRPLQPASLAVGDFNGDGASDIAMINLESDDVSIVLRHV